MEVPLKQRIVGAIVLVTLGVIFIPALLDGSGYKSRQVQDIEIKEKPDFPPLSSKRVEPVPTPVDDIRQKQTEALAADPKTPDKQPIRSFALQVGTFGSNDNAMKLQKQLQEAGYTTFVHKSASKGETSYKVRIGPELERSKLEKIKDKVKKTHKIDGYVVNHP